MFVHLVFPGINEIIDVFGIIEMIEGIAILEPDFSAGGGSFEHTYKVFVKNRTRL